MITNKNTNNRFRSPKKINDNLTEFVPSTPKFPICEVLLSPAKMQRHQDTKTQTKKDDNVIESNDKPIGVDLSMLDDDYSDIEYYDGYEEDVEEDTKPSKLKTFLCITLLEGKFPYDSQSFLVIKFNDGNMIKINRIDTSTSLNRPVWNKTVFFNITNLKRKRFHYLYIGLFDSYGSKLIAHLKLSIKNIYFTKYEKWFYMEKLSDSLFDDFKILVRAETIEEDK